MLGIVGSLWPSGSSSGQVASHTGAASSLLSNKLVRWAIAAGAPLTVLYLLRPRSTTGGDEDDRRDFDAFLKKPEAVGSTGAPAPAPGRRSGPIDGFFKDAGTAEVEDHRNPLDFSSFLKTAIPGGGAGTVAATVPAAHSGNASQQAVPEPSGDSVRVAVMYGTEYGFSKEIAEKLCARLAKDGVYWPVLVDLADHPEGYDFSAEQAALVACSTQGDGVPPTEARPFCEWLFSGKAGDLSHLRFAVCALGDRSYQHFCRCGKLLDEALGKAGGQRLAPRVEVNKEDWKAVDG